MEEQESMQRPIYSVYNLLKEAENREVVRTVVAVMMLAINGGAVLAIPGAFASTGVICATLLLAVVALAQAYTNNMLLWQCQKCNQKDYEGLCNAIAGPYWMLLCEIGLVVLMLGSLVSGIQQFGETVASGVSFMAPRYSGILTEGNGRLVMVAVVLCFCVPLVFIKSLKQLEAAGDVGLVINQVMITAVVICAISRGFPKLGKEGEFEIAGFKSPGYNLQLLGTLSYCMYIQPFSVAMLAEMPSGARGVHLLSIGTTIAITGTAVFVYFICGFFGASTFGRSAYDVGNILENDLGGSGFAQGALNLIFTIYLVLSTPPTEFVARHSMLKWWAALASRFPAFDARPIVRQVTLAILIYGSCLSVAVTFPDKSAQVIAVTGAVGCTLISYFIPIVNHFCLYFGSAQCSVQAPMANSTTSLDCKESLLFNLLTEELLDVKEQDVCRGDGRSDVSNSIIAGYPSFTREGWSAINVLLPALVLCGGVLCGISVLANFDVI